MAEFVDEGDSHDVRQSEPIIVHGRNPHELPRKALGSLLLGPHSVFAAVTGPDGGLTTVNQRQRHLSTSDPDVDYIDILEHQAEQGRNAVSSAGGGCVFSPGYDRWFTVRPPARPLDNSVMHIRAAGAVFSVGKRSVHTSVSDLPFAVSLDAGSRGKNASLDFELDGNYDNNNLPPSAHDYSTFNFSGVSDGVGAGGGVYLRGVTVGSATYGCNTARRCDDNDAFLPPAANNRDKESRVFVDERESGPANVLCSDLTPVELNGNGGVTEEVVIDEYLVIPPPAEYAGGNLADNDAVGFTPIRKSKSAPPPLSAWEASMGLGQRLESAHSAGSGPRLGEIAGVSDWSRTHQRAYGAATTLYERHPLTQENAGNPIADCFAVVARRNSAILAIADGVNWGEKACVAARSAIHGCVDYLNKAMFSGAASTTPVTNTTVCQLARRQRWEHNLCSVRAIWELICIKLVEPSSTSCTVE
uniref:PPM-type phosphatase domain-containing protein n=1 Tax=Timema douglasi TaxID=61478 RepID=A0A7R8VSZ4_TIMDO|nr:unnamed protein product [Timema douglasi]